MVPKIWRCWSERDSPSVEDDMIHELDLMAVPVFD
jgi:hypothetical protein